MKKIIVVLLMLLVAASVMVSCRQQGNPNPPVVDDLTPDAPVIVPAVVNGTATELPKVSI